MRRKVAYWVVVVMMFNLVLSSWTLVAQAQTEMIPTINRITVKEEIEVVNGVRNTKYQVVFNGYPMTNINAIHVMQKNENGIYTIKNTLPKERFVQITSAEIAYIPESEGQTLESIFGATGEIYFAIVQNNRLYFEEIHKQEAFIVPTANLMKVDTINQFSPSSWPITVIKGESFTVEGTHFDAFHSVDNKEGYKLGVTTGSLVANTVDYTVENPQKTQIRIGTDTLNIHAGLNQNLIFEKVTSNGKMVIRHIVKKAVDIANPLDLRGVDISPLEGTQGTILRIKAGNDTPLVDAGTKVFLDGVEAKRNISEFSNGTFTYREGGQTKLGLEVVVPRFTNVGQKTITIRNYFQDVYEHDEKFTYSEASGSILQVMDVSPSVAFTNEEKYINNLRIRNAVAVNNLPEQIRAEQIDKILTSEDAERNLRFFTNLDPKSYYLQYELKDGRFIERKITVSIGRKASIIKVPPTWNNQGITTLEVRTDKVGDAGIYTITARTETVLYSLDGAGNINESAFIIEEAPYSNQPKVNFEFKPDSSTPVVARITPQRGPHDQEIVATIEGSNFYVENINGEIHYPTIFIGNTSLQSQYKYKVIRKDGVYRSNQIDGTGLVDVGTDSQEDIAFSFQVLDAAGNVVDGQARKVGTKIKFTIPAGEAGISGFADVIVYNPSITGDLGGRSIRENLFEYVVPSPGALLPQITAVEPSKVAVGKQEQVIIRGRNFHPQAVVTIDGEVVTTRDIDVVRGTITFRAPVGRPGNTYLQVINPDGGFASHPFEYIQTFTQPYIERIIPNIGGKGSLVIIKGRSFVLPNPQGETRDIQIGTKLYIDNKDVNEKYFSNGTDLELRDFVNPYDENPETNTILGPNGKAIKTYGSHVAIVDHETIYFIVPDPNPMDSDKTFFQNQLLDVKVVNPDLGNHELKRAFKIIDVVTKPYIESISPGLGDYLGGNIVEIRGENFLENTKVYFGTQQAQVYRRSHNAKILWVYVPPYGGSLGSTNRATVPVTIQNPDGGSYTKYDGYLYVNPGYTATITKVTPSFGNTSGGDRVMISGINFRARDLGKGTQELPAVYFGGVRVKPEDITFVLPPKDSYNPLETTDLIIVENTPSNQGGRVDITVINYDGGTANLKNGFEYRSRQPAITTVLPSNGTRLGGSEITITGRDFIERGLHVVFGNEVGKRDVLSGQATVTLGDVVVHYNAYAPEENISLYYKEIKPGNELPILIDGTPKENSRLKLIEEEEYVVVTIPWSAIAPEENLANENIKIEIKNSDLIVTRRLGIIKKIEGEQRITLLTPPSPEIGEKTITVYNFDGKNAQWKFTYTNPYRAPVITEITPTTEIEVASFNGEIQNPPMKMNLAVSSPAGGSPLIIKGENFRAGVRVFIGNKEAEIKSKGLNDDELIIIVPPSAGDIQNYLRILIVNADGGQAYGDIVPPDQNRNPYYFKYVLEGSYPKIASIAPNEGPASGGTRVTVRGSDFKDQDTLGNPKTVDIYVGGVKVGVDGNIRILNHQTIEFNVPAGRIGKQTIEIVNYDQGRAIAKDIFTYISQPEILTVNPEVLFTNDTNTEVTISGKMFMAGARVFIGGELVNEENLQPGQVVKASGIQGVVNGKNQRRSLVGGVEAASVVVESENIMKVKFKEAFDLKNNHIIIVNPDGGISQAYRGFEYKIPVPNKPLVLEAIPGYESTVQLLWSGSLPEVLNGAERYEIYGKKVTDRQYTFLGDTRETEFLVKNLLVNTEYSFTVRALNRYGSALEFAEVKVRTFSEREDTKLKEKQEQLKREQEKLDREGKEETVGNTLIKTIGKQQIPYSISSYVIDFSLSQYKNYEKFTVAIPLSIINGLNRSITLQDENMSFTFKPQDLYTREVSQVSSKDMEDAHVRVSFERLIGKGAESLTSAVKRTQVRASQIYEITFELQAGKNITPLQGMLRNGTLEFYFDSRAYPNAKVDKIFVGQYNPSSDAFVEIGKGQKGDIRNTGRYMLLSNR